METKESLVVDGLPFALPPYLAEHFEKADSQLKEHYGISPGVPTLVRLWFACGTPSRIKKEFERTALDLTKSDLSPNEEGHFDENSL
jgi:hypothetical protein